MKSFFKHHNNPNSIPVDNKSLTAYQNDLPLSKSLTDNINILHGLFFNCNDIIYHEFNIDPMKRSAMLIFMSGLVDTKMINENIISPLMNIKDVSIETLAPDGFTEIAKRHILQIAGIKDLFTIGEVEHALLNGDAVLLLDGDIKALNMSTPGFKERNVSESTVEKVIRGPKEGFTENINTNTAMLRRKIKSSKLKFEEYLLGRQTRTKVNITYLQGIVSDSVVKEVRKRIENLDVDSILESGYIEELIEDTPYTLFPQIQHSERPDKVAAAILEGRVAILIDGTPFVLIVPATMIQFFQTADDYYERYSAATAIRLIRFIFFGIALFLPGLYVAIIAFHKEMLPTPLLISIIQAERGVPFPIFIEVLIIEVTFEALREAGIRLPTAAGPTVGIVGAVVIGEAAVKAGIVSSITVILISVTAVASFSMPSYDMGYTIRILRFILLILGAYLGLYGIMLGILVLLIHLASLKSFDVNYLSPIAPLEFKDLKDVLLRFPWWFMEERPSSTNLINPHRHRHRHQLR